MIDKRKELKKFKILATGLLILMIIIFILTTWGTKAYPEYHLLSYIKAFAEAGMVGALADWFAVTALFRHPLGLRIPHTNLLETNKKRIGTNLGEFIEKNFLTPKNLKPYLQNLSLSKSIGLWLIQPHHQTLIIQEGKEILLKIFQQIEDQAVSRFISEKLQTYLPQIPVSRLGAQALHYILDQGHHQEPITRISAHIEIYIRNNKEMIRERVRRESHFLIPDIIDQTIAEKLTSGLIDFFSEIKQNPEHHIRKEINQKIRDFANELPQNPVWEEQITKGLTEFSTSEELPQYASKIWMHLKKEILQMLEEPQCPMEFYFRNQLQILANKMLQGKGMAKRFDHFSRFYLYRMILRNTHRVSQLVETTIGGWHSQDLSQKLELEVGKDLQFIRINGTLVGGLVGLLIHIISGFI